ncbi:MAG TPA: YihY/virulence factor BrkB family protein [Propionibacteriaceae bacterium]|nr:YihY/virulence factor BrkB family protein [Propionibacteriaceae bacterium]
MTARSETEPAAEGRSLASRRHRAGSTLWRLMAQVLGACLRYRVTGLAAEAAFFAVLSLPPLIFGLAGAIGFVAQRFDVQTIAGFREQVLALASKALTPDAVVKVIEPTLDEVLSGGRFEVISIGFVIALWSGSRALNVFVDTITIMYGMAGRRSIVRTRALSFSLYLVFLLVGVVLLPLVLAGPGFVAEILPNRLDVVGRLYWPTVLLGSVCILTSLYHLSVPVRTRWRSDLPGATLTLGMWIGGSILLRVVLAASTGSTSIYGPLAAPIAVLVWLYLISIAILIGAAFNAAADKVFPSLSGMDRSDRENLLKDAPERPA